ncbi:unnamed protein product [Closterium sp. NIES-54]
MRRFMEPKAITVATKRAGHSARRKKGNGAATSEAAGTGGRSLLAAREEESTPADEIADSGKAAAEEPRMTRAELRAERLDQRGERRPDDAPQQRLRSRKEDSSNSRARGSCGGRDEEPAYVVEECRWTAERREEVTRSPGERQPRAERQGSGGRSPPREWLRGGRGEDGSRSPYRQQPRRGRGDMESRSPEPRWAGRHGEDPTEAFLEQLHRQFHGHTAERIKEFQEFRRGRAESLLTYCNRLINVAEDVRCSDSSLLISKFLGGLDGAPGGGLRMRVYELGAEARLDESDWQQPICLLELFGGIGAGLSAVVRSGMAVRRWIYVEKEPVVRRMAEHHAWKLQAEFPELLSGKVVQEAMGGTLHDVRDITVAEVASWG